MPVTLRRGPARQPLYRRLAVFTRLPTRWNDNPSSPRLRRAFFASVVRSQGPAIRSFRYGSEEWCSREDLHLEPPPSQDGVHDSYTSGANQEIGPGGRIRTRTGSVLSGVPLLFGLRREEWWGQRDLHPHRDLHRVGCCSYTMTPTSKIRASGRIRAGIIRFTRAAHFWFCHGGIGKLVAGRGVAPRCGSM